jgi:hypothetical protein
MELAYSYDSVSGRCSVTSSVIMNHGASYTCSAVFLCKVQLSMLVDVRLCSSYTLLDLNQNPLSLAELPVVHPTSTLSPQVWKYFVIFQRQIITLINSMGHAVAQWLRHCATNRKVAWSIPDGVNGNFYWHNPSGRTMALESTQPLTEMSTRNNSWGKGGWCVGLTNLPLSCTDCLKI